MILMWELRTSQVSFSFHRLKYSCLVCCEFNQSQDKAKNAKLLFNLVDCPELRLKLCLSWHDQHREGTDRLM